MKAAKRLGLALTAPLLLALAVPATAGQTPAYTTFVACGYDRDRPSTIEKTHLCRPGEIIGAFFRRNFGQPGSLIHYTVCVTFSRGETSCKARQPARKQGRRLYVNRIIRPGPGLHEVNWFVKGKRVGRWTFRRTRGSAPRFETHFACNPFGARDADRVCFVGDLPAAVLIARFSDRVTYTVCIRAPREDANCRRRRSGRAGRPSTAAFEIDRTGRYVATWYIRGKRLDRDRLRVRAENARP